MNSNGFLSSIPPVTRNLLFINIILFMVQQLFAQQGGDVLTNLFGLHFFLASDFRIWQVVTYMFLHGSWSHVLLNMFSLWMFGRIIERTMGERRFIVYYFLCGIGAALCQELWQLGQYYVEGLYAYPGITDGSRSMAMDDFLNTWVTIGASGACYGVLLAFGMTFPEERIMLLFPPIPMKAKFFVVGYALIEAFSAFSSNGNIAHFAHLGGMFFGWLYFRHWRKQLRGYRDYGSSRGIFQRIRSAFQSFGAMIERIVRDLFRSSPRNAPSSQTGTPYESDREYNLRQRRKQERVDAILEKVRRSGYASLTEEEKKELFENTKR